MPSRETATHQGRKEKLLEEIHTIVDRPVRLMVVCSTQNRAILRYGLHDQLPGYLDLVAGPGCSVCVMPAGHIDAFVKVAVQPGVITAVCDDLLIAPGSTESLESVMKKGADIELITSPMEALEIALQEPGKTIVYPAVGFEATAPSVAEAILEAARLGLENFCVIPSIRLLPPTIDVLMLDPDLSVQGLLCSDHINSISDADAYTALAKKHKISCYIGGFEIEDILEGIIYLVRQVQNCEYALDDTAAFTYSSDEKKRARKMVSEVFFAVDTLWRGLGNIEQSGFVIRDELSLYDATKRFNIRFTEGQEQCLCQCSDIISGRGLPSDCPAFGVACTPQNPIGPCMITKEGICNSYLKYNFGSPLLI